MATSQLSRPTNGLLQCLFFAVFVARSVDLALIDLEHLYVAGDGTKLATWAKAHGKKLCSV